MKNDNGKDVNNEPRIIYDSIFDLAVGVTDVLSVLMIMVKLFHVS